MRSVRPYLLLALVLLTTAALGPGGTFVDDNGNLHEPVDVSSLQVDPDSGLAG